MTVFALDPLDLAALLCSRVCHDVISPVGAIINGLEVLDEEKDEEMRGYAMDLIKKSAEQASARLQFCRLAFGAAGSAGASIDTGDAEKVARGLFGGERTQLEWNVPHLLMPKNQVKLILNLCLIAAATVPRGGTIAVSLNGGSETARISVTAQGTNAKLAGHLPGLLKGTPEQPPSGPHDIQAYYAGLVATDAKMVLTVAAETDCVRIEAEPMQAIAKVL
ncbi:histidine phosphotransferase family protein [Methylocapsa sp. D3K7]|uniref:histidine phosphotransferase ChpT n=1 Tax=Methylocapsa sp. D3K7 TaxID=3041435 RepID=UPI00244E77EF|nr:histidine phosphotransferase family protein [Methylocapsa sp. D3K7]WGJ15093.1 histidine phosphotransferase family protein [Methylocapsa sp. D3K7]